MAQKVKVQCWGPVWYLKKWGCWCWWVSSRSGWLLELLTELIKSRKIVSPNSDSPNVLVVHNSTNGGSPNVNGPLGYSPNRQLNINLYLYLCTAHCGSVSARQGVRKGRNWGRRLSRRQQHCWTQLSASSSPLSFNQQHQHQHQHYRQPFLLYHHQQYQRKNCTYFRKVKNSLLFYRYLKHQEHGASKSRPKFNFKVVTKKFSSKSW